MRLRFPLAVLTASSLLLGACGGDDDDVSTDDTPSAVEDGGSTADDTGSTTETETETEGAGGDRSDEQLAADQEVAEGAVLALEDMPAGWEETPSEEDDDDIEQEAVAECVGADVDELYDDEDPEADSTFASPEDSTVDSGVTIAATLELAEFRFETLTSDEALECLREELVAKIAEDAGSEDMQIGEVTINRMSAADVGEDSTALRVTVPVTVQGTEVTVYIDTVFFRSGRAIGTVAYMALFSPPATGELEGFAQTMADRIDPAAVS